MATIAPPVPVDWRSVAVAELHPLRIQIIEEAAVVDEVAPVYLAARFNAPLGNVAYHVRELAKVGVLVQTRTEQCRGAIKTYYRLTDGARIGRAA